MHIRLNEQQANQEQAWLTRNQKHLAHKRVCHSHREQYSSNSNAMVYSSTSCTPSGLSPSFDLASAASQKSGKENKENLNESTQLQKNLWKRKQTNRYKNMSNEHSMNFINGLECYMNELSGIKKSSIHSMKTSRICSGQNCLTSGQNSANKSSKMPSNFHQINTKLKTLKLANHILQQQNKQANRKQKQMKYKMYGMLDHIRQLTNQLEKQRASRRKNQSFLNQLQHLIITAKNSNKFTIPIKSNKLAQGRKTNKQLVQYNALCSSLSDFDLSSCFRTQSDMQQQLQTCLKRSRRTSSTINKSATTKMQSIGKMDRKPYNNSSNRHSQKKYNHITKEQLNHLFDGDEDHMDNDQFMI